MIRAGHRLLKLNLTVATSTGSAVKADERFPRLAFIQLLDGTGEREQTVSLDRSILHTVMKHYDACFKSLAGDEFKVSLFDPFGKKRDARTDQHRMNL